MKKIVYLFLLSSLFLLQSCFEIIEQVLVKADGSGSFQLLVNMSRSKTKINSIMKMKTANGHKVPDKETITNEVAAIEKTIRSTAGLSNVKTSLDFDNYIATINCDFSKVDNLNTAIKNIAVQNKSSKPIEKSYSFDITGKNFNRFNSFPLKDEYKNMSNADKEIFATANYTSIFRFEKNIMTASNKDGKIAANKKAVMVKLNALDLLSSKKSIENKINF